MNRAQGFYESGQGNYTPHGLVGSSHAGLPLYINPEETHMNKLVDACRKHGIAAWDRSHFTRPPNLKDLDITALVKFIDARLDELSEEADAEAHQIVHIEGREDLEPWVGFYWNLVQGLTSITDQAEAWSDGDLGEIHRWTILTIAQIWKDHDDFPAGLVPQPTLLEDDGGHEL